MCGNAEKLKFFEAQDRENGYFDITFDIHGKLLHAHKIMLAPVSTTFKAMFSRSPSSSAANKPIVIYDYKYADFYRLLTFLYY
uniref:BTB domain-containing protein n=1 Tax=Panagrolaimus sp. ES5 TaxID=591445 RepID=A0AC34G029_9BILA